MIKPHIPAVPQSLSVETGGAAILGGLMVFSGVGSLAYLGDMYYKHKKEKRDVKTKAPPKSMFEDWEKAIEKEGFEIVPPDRGASFMMDSPDVLEDEKRTAARSVADSHIWQEGEKRVTLTVEDPNLGSVYNFTLYLSAQSHQSNGYQNFKLAGVRRCLTYNPDIIDLEFRRPNGREVQTGANFWNELGEDEMFLATAKVAPPPS